MIQVIVGEKSPVHSQPRNRTITERFDTKAAVRRIPIWGAQSFRRRESDEDGGRGCDRVVLPRQIEIARRLFRRFFGPEMGTKAAARSESPQPFKVDSS